MSGERHNNGKPKLSMVLEANNALRGAAQVLMMGEKKYSRSNWKKGLKQTEVVDSLMRHLLQYMNGENLDPESTLPHVDHILVNALFLAEMAHAYPQFDDRAIVRPEPDPMMPPVASEGPLDPPPPYPPSVDGKTHDQMLRERILKHESGDFED